MTNKEAIEMLTAKAECIRREVSGTDFACNLRNCDECDLCYAQGTTGEQREALGLAIKALEAQDGQVAGKLEPCKDALDDAYAHGYTEAEAKFYQWREEHECEDAVSRQEVLDLFARNADHTRPYHDTWQDVKNLLPVTPKPKTGKWRWTRGELDKMSGSRFEKWACDCCGMKFESKSNFRPNCGAKVEG